MLFHVQTTIMKKISITHKSTFSLEKKEDRIFGMFQTKSIKCFILDK